MVRAKPAIAWPLSVSATVRVSRRTSWRPHASSSRRTCWDTVGWLSPSCSAARVKLSPVATARNVRSSTGSKFVSAATPHPSAHSLAIAMRNIAAILSAE